MTVPLLSELKRKTKYIFSFSTAPAPIPQIDSTELDLPTDTYCFNSRKQQPNQICCYFLETYVLSADEKGEELSSIFVLNVFLIKSSLNLPHFLVNAHVTKIVQDIHVIIELLDWFKPVELVNPCRKKKDLQKQPE